MNTTLRSISGYPSFAEKGGNIDVAFRKVWAHSLVLLDGHLPKHTRVHEGLLLTNGDDPSRSVTAGIRADRLVSTALLMAETAVVGPPPTPAPKRRRRGRQSTPAPPRRCAPPLPAQAAASTSEPIGPRSSAKGDDGDSGKGEGEEWEEGNEDEDGEAEGEDGEEREEGEEGEEGEEEGEGEGEGD